MVSSIRKIAKGLESHHASAGVLLNKAIENDILLGKGNRGVPNQFAFVTEFLYTSVGLVDQVCITT